METEKEKRARVTWDDGLWPYGVWDSNVQDWHRTVNGRIWKVDTLAEAKVMANRLTSPTYPGFHPRHGGSLPVYAAQVAPEWR